MTCATILIFNELRINELDTYYIKKKMIHTYKPMANLKNNRTKTNLNLHLDFMLPYTDTKMNGRIL